MHSNVNTLSPQPQQSAPRLIAIPDVSTITSLCKTSVYELIKAGELRFVKIGKKTLFVESEVYEWVNKRLENRGELSSVKIGKKTIPVKSEIHGRVNQRLASRGA